MKQNRAVVLLFNGEEPTACAITEISACLAASCSTSIESVNAFTFSGDELAKDLVKKVVSVERAPMIEYTPEEHAVIYIGTQFRKVLESHDTLAFATEFGLHITTLKFTNSDPKMLKAVKILANCVHPVIRDEIRQRYNLSNKTIEVIQRIGRNV